MIRTLDPAGEMLLAQLGKLSARLDRAQREISSGLRVNSVSDAPDMVADILALRASLESNAQIRTNLERAKAEAETADVALQKSVQALERAITLASQGAGSLAAGTRGAIAQEVRGLEEELVALSRTTYGDRYLFSGDLEQAPCYELNLDAEAGVNELASPEATRQLQHPSGVAFPPAKTAREIFDDREADGTRSAKNAFAAVDGLRRALEADDQAAIAESLGSLREASAHLNTQLGFYGAVENRIAGAIDDSGKLDVRLKAALSDRQDADLAEAILELQQVQLSQSAALQARSQVRKSSLFDYLR